MIKLQMMRYKRLLNRLIMRHKSKQNRLVTRRIPNSHKTRAWLIGNALGKGFSTISRAIASIPILYIAIVPHLMMFFITSGKAG